MNKKPCIVCLYSHPPPLLVSCNYRNLMNLFQVIGIYFTQPMQTLEKQNIHSGDRKGL